MATEVQYKLMRKNRNTHRLTPASMGYLTDEKKALESLDRERKINPELHFVLVSRTVSYSDWEVTE